MHLKQQMQCAAAPHDLNCSKSACLQLLAAVPHDDPTRQRVFVPGTVQRCVPLIWRWLHFLQEAVADVLRVNLYVILDGTIPGWETFFK